VNSLDRIQRFAVAAGLRNMEAFPAHTTADATIALLKANVRGTGEELGALHELQRLTRAHLVVHLLLRALREGLSGRHEAFRDALLQTAGTCLAWADEIDGQLKTAGSDRLTGFAAWLERKRR
jgi:hypothetical protein